ncbi:MAG: hypothetical protein J6Q41_08245 [Firmicutes bacterium]|nr:hypothetical protein [Bacillota bacterium]
MITSKELELLFDSNSFMEIGEKQECSVITGYGTVNGRLVYAFLQDREIAGGAFGLTCGNKISKIYKLAFKAKAPVVGFLDSTGFLIEDGSLGLDAFNKVYSMASAASDSILQIMITGEECLGQMLGLAQMADFTFEGKDIAEALTKANEVIRTMPPYSGALQDQYDTADDLNRANEGIAKKRASGRDVLKEISDDGFLLEMEDKAPGFTTGFVKLNGLMVAAMANNETENGSAMDFKALVKALKLIRTAVKFDLPIINVSNTEGFAKDEDPELMAWATKEVADALINAHVPKINLITGKVRGGIYSVMNGRNGASDLTFIWKDAEVSILDPKVAAELLYGPLDLADVQPKTDEYIRDFASGEALEASGLADKVIDPEDSRKYLVGALETYANVF